MMPQAAPRAGWFSRWDLIPLAASLALLGFLRRALPGWPDPLPTHFDAAGRANGWTTHDTYLGMVLIIPAFAWLLLLCTGWAFAGSAQDPEGRKASALAPLRACTAAGVQVLMLSPMAMARLGHAGLGLSFAAFLLLLSVGLGLMFRAMKWAGVETPHAECYRWGLFYVNPDDPAVWVPKRLGLGWTLNFAHRRSWVMLGLLLMPVLLVLALTLFR
jgi:uncharacterized membrane protein